jgi:hypothetical protein
MKRQIEEAVYELYGLTEEEIKIVEGEIVAAMVRNSMEYDQ